jgi:hypothetical protein
VSLQVGSIMNFSLMYLLAKTPASAATAGSGNIIARLFDENTLKSMGAPGTLNLSTPLNVHVQRALHDLWA